MNHMQCIGKREGRQCSAVSPTDPPNAEHPSDASKSCEVSSAERALQCVGKTASGSRCQNQSLMPNSPKWPEIYLCSVCANEPPRNSRRNSKGIVEQPRIKGII